MIRLRGCTGWFAPLLFAHEIVNFSHNGLKSTLPETLAYKTEKYENNVQIKIRIVQNCPQVHVYSCPYEMMFYGRKNEILSLKATIPISKWQYFQNVMP